MSNSAASVIISVYKDIRELSVILDSLKHQSVPPNEVIISEDGNSDEMRQYIQRITPVTWTRLKHLTQNDDGFQKNRALNRATIAARNEVLIFIDGDCVPHQHFVEQHLRLCQNATLVVGRRAELGWAISALVTHFPALLRLMQKKWLYFPLIPLLALDKGSAHIEAGLYLPGFQARRVRKLLGSNFSIHRNQLVAINGFNEQYRSPGYGEDTDIEWRLLQNNVEVVDAKFSAVQFHLYHPVRYHVITENKAIFQKTKEENLVKTTFGIQEK